MAINVAEIKRRLHSLLNDTNLVNDYLRQYGPMLDIKHIKTIKDAHARRKEFGKFIHLGSDGICGGERVGRGGEFDRDARPWVPHGAGEHGVALPSEGDAGDILEPDL